MINHKIFCILGPAGLELASPEHARDWHSALIELNWSATSRPSYATRSLVSRVSVTIWLAAANLGQLSLVVVCLFTAAWSRPTRPISLLRGRFFTFDQLIPCSKIQWKLATPSDVKDNMFSVKQEIYLVFSNASWTSMRRSGRNWLPHAGYCLYFTVGPEMPPHKLPFPRRGSGAHLKRGFLGPPKSIPQTESRSVQPFQRSSRLWPTDGQTDRLTQSTLTVCSVTVRCTAFTTTGPMLLHIATCCRFRRWSKQKTVHW